MQTPNMNIWSKVSLLYITRRPVWPKLVCCLFLHSLQKLDWCFFQVGQFMKHISATLCSRALVQTCLMFISEDDWSHVDCVHLVCSCIARNKSNEFKSTCNIYFSSHYIYMYYIYIRCWRRQHRTYNRLYLNCKCKCICRVWWVCILRGSSICIAMLLWVLHVTICIQMGRSEKVYHNMSAVGCTFFAPIFFVNKSQSLSPT